MPAAVAGPEIERLIQLLARLPGLGPRSARRAALHLIKKRELLMAPLAAALETAMEKIEICKVCGNIDTKNPCTVCTDTRRDASIIVVVANVADLWALERAHAVNGRYHVLGGTLSPLDGVGPQDLTIDSLISRAHETHVKEVIRALNRVGYSGPLSVEWEDIGMEREFGAREACAKIKALDFAASTVAFDAAFAAGG